jgi:hypothetical protein
MDERKAKGAGFELAHEVLGSAVRRLELSVYDLDSSAVGRFDFVYLGSLLLHLRDPVGALMKVHDVCSGELLVVDAVDLRLSMLLRRPAAGLDAVGRPWWWKPNPAGLARMAEAAGFEVVEGPRRFFMPFGAGGPKPRVRARRLHTREGREQALLALRGDPHAALLARPRR